MAPRPPGKRRQSCERRVLTRIRSAGFKSSGSHRKLFCMFLKGLLLASSISAALLSPATAKVRASRPDGYQVVHAYPHDPNAFTQGLVYVDGHLYESTGLNGHSSLRMVDLPTGRVLQHHELPAEYFGEGLSNWDGSLVQLTWKTGTAFVYDRFSFALQRTLHYAGEGWGLTHDGNSLIMSDGSSVLRFLDPRTFRETRRLSVRDENGRPLLDINELEYIREEIYANVWRTDRIARISPRTGKVLGWIDLSGLMDKSRLSDPDAVLNGIAYDSKWAGCSSRGSYGRNSSRLRWCIGVAADFLLIVRPLCFANKPASSFTDNAALAGNGPE
jgi:glutaminyl-peptide cyclotransferase